MKYSKFKVLGLQRTGTNWINELIKNNFSVEEEQGFWKHLTPLGVKKNAPLRHFKSYFDIKDDTFYILVSKPKKMWKISIERNCVDFYKTHKVSNLDEVYNSWISWKNDVVINKNFYYNDYNFWLDNWEDYLKEISNLTGWQFKNYNVLNTTKVPMSPNFNISNYR